MKEGVGCDEKDFSKVTNALKQQAKKSESFKLGEDNHHRELLNCGFICCSFPYGYCRIYQPACAGYPTRRSNRLYCNRRELFEEPNQGIIIIDEVEKKVSGSLRGLQEDTATNQEEHDKCRKLKMEAITSILNKISVSCADLVLLPTRLQCFGADE